jgi:hypothetical protein
MIPFNKQGLRLRIHVLDLKKNLTMQGAYPSQICKTGRQCATVHMGMQHFAPYFRHFVASACRLYVLDGMMRARSTAHR